MICLVLFIHEIHFIKYSLTFSNGSWFDLKDHFGQIFVTLLLNVDVFECFG